MGEKVVCSQKVTHCKMNAPSATHSVSPRPYLHIYAHSNELEEIGIVSLTGVNVESDPRKASLLGVSRA
jgi:hypothetical protein